jgi:hypothetical protein
MQISWCNTCSGLPDPSSGSCTKRVAMRLSRIAGRVARGLSTAADAAHAAVVVAVAPPLYVGAPHVHAGGDYAEVQRVLRSASEAGAALALDTEFTSFPSYKPALELIQVGESGGAAACIDCANLSPAALVDLLGDAVSNCELVVHDGMRAYTHTTTPHTAHRLLDRYP